MAGTPHASGGAAEAATAGANMTRGEFLTKASVGVGGLLGLMIGVPVAGMALSPAVSGADFTAVNAGPLSQFTEGTWVKVTLDPGAGNPDAYIRKRVAFVRKNAAGFKDSLTGAADEYTVISNRCAHLGCPVQESGGQFVCPCHGGAYDKDGGRTAGPPVRPLDRFEYEVRGDELWITGEHSLTNKGEKVALRSPGQHSSAPQGLLYPIRP